MMGSLRFGLRAGSQAGQAAPAAHPLSGQEIPPGPTLSHLVSRPLVVSLSRLLPSLPLYYSHTLVANTVVHGFFKQIIRCLILLLTFPGGLAVSFWPFRRYSSSCGTRNLYNCGSIRCSPRWQLMGWTCTRSPRVPPPSAPSIPAGIIKPSLGAQPAVGDREGR